MDYYLKDIQKEDLNMIFDWRNKEHIRLSMFNTHKIQWQEHCDWYNRISTHKDREYKLLVYKNIPIGFVSFININIEEGFCFWGFYLGKDNLPKGTGKYLAHVSLDYIFNKYKLEKVIGEVLENNIVSINYHKRIGFELHTNIREIYWNGRQMQVFRFELTRDNWLKKRVTLI